MSYIATFISALILALSHLIVSRLRFFEGPRAHLWRSMTGGAAVSFVFLSILPGLEKQQDILEVTAIVPFTAHHRVYLLCLAGFLAYYGFRRLATRVLDGRCVQCGYLLLHLPDARCPECGKAFVRAAERGVTAGVPSAEMGGHEPGTGLRSDE